MHDPRILVDTTVLIAAVNRKDANHARAQAVLKEVASGRWGKPLIPDYVLLETVNWLLRTRGLSKAQAFVRSLRERQGVSTVGCSASLPSILKLFLGQRHTHLGFTDAALVALARQGGARQVASLDADFHAFIDVPVIDRPGASA